MGLEIWKYAAIAFFIVSLGLATVLALGTLEVRQEYKCPKQAACQEESAGKLGKCAASLEKCSGKRVAADERIALLERQNLQLSQGIANLTKQLAQKNGQGAIEEGGEGARVAQKELNLTRLRQEAQDAINAQRQAYNSTPVGQNDILNSLAQKCSDFILRTENFAHKSCAQEFGEVHARVVDAGVHSVVTFEDLSTGPIEWYVSGEGIIQGYLDSPSHRSSIVDLDGLTNKVGVGVSCTQSKCVNSIILSGTKTKKTGSLGPKYETWFPLVNEGFGFSKNPTVRVIGKLSFPLDFYIINKAPAQGAYFEPTRADYTYYKPFASGINYTEIVPGGYVLLINRHDVKTSDYNIELEYLDG